MILRITNEQMGEVPLNCQVMPISEFKDIHNHPWLVTQNFEAVVVDICEEIPSGYLKALMGRYIVVPKLPEQLNLNIMRFLGELYPEDSAKFIYSYMRDKDALNKLLEEYAEKFEWNKYLVD